MAVVGGAIRSWSSRAARRNLSLRAFSFFEAIGMGIASGYHAWMDQARRTGSRQVPFGEYWRMHDARWRVSWIEDTGELYAADVRSDRFFVLGHFATRREVTRKMQRWFQGGNLQGLIASLKH